MLLKSNPRYPCYLISDTGKILSIARPGTKGGWMKLTLAGSGYYQVRLSNNNKKEFPLVHRLVLETFVGPCPHGMQACHRNDIKTDNRLENLYWGTAKDNSRDALINGKHHHKGPEGEKSATAKLNEKQVKSIVKLFDSGNYSKAELGRRFGVTAMNIKSIVNKESWKHLWAK